MRRNYTAFASLYKLNKLIKNNKILKLRTIPCSTEAMVSTAEFSGIFNLPLRKIHTSDPQFTGEYKFLTIE